MFQPKAIFQAGLKIIGVATIIWGLVHITTVIYLFFSVYNQADVMIESNLRYYRISLIFQVLYPILLVIIGGYLLKGGQAIMKMISWDLSERDDDQIGSLFLLFMKLAGLVLIIYSIPKAFQLLSNLMFVSSEHALGTSEQTQFIVQNSVSVVISLIFGFYLLRSGELFYKIGFAKKEDKVE